MRLPDLKAQAQEHYRERLDWTDTGFGGAWADVDHHTVCVLVDPPDGKPHIAKIIGGKQEPLEGTGEWKSALTVTEPENVRNAEEQDAAGNATEPHPTRIENADFATAANVSFAVEPDNATTATEQVSNKRPRLSLANAVQLALKF